MNIPNKVLLSIFLRPISPYGCAARSKSIAEYQTGAFIEFYKMALSDIVERNRRGTPMVELYAQILLTKIAFSQVVPH
jgi:hypothetical protein